MLKLYLIGALFYLISKTASKGNEKKKYHKWWLKPVLKLYWNLTEIP